MSVKFSIGIPAYKSQFLKECIDSILVQSYTDFELIIVNDNSPENIENIVNFYSDARIKYYKNKINFGAENVVDNWNKCLSYAKGEYFILMGDDDKMDIDYLAEFNMLISKFPGLEVYHCRSKIIDEKSVIIGFTDPRPEFESVYDSIIERIKSRVFFISDYVYKVSTLRLNGGYFKLPLAWGSDDITSYIAAQNSGIAHSNKPVFLYRKSSITISSTGSVYKKIEAILEEEKWLSIFLDVEPEGNNDKILRINIRNMLKKYIQKKKIVTIYTLVNLLKPQELIKWFFDRKKYGLSLSELAFAFLLCIKDKRKINYD